MKCLGRPNFFPPPDKLDLKRRRTERIRRERIESSLTNDMENRRRSRSNSQSDPIRRGRGRPKTVGLKKQEDDKGKKPPRSSLIHSWGSTGEISRYSSEMKKVNDRVDDFISPFAEKQEKEVDIYAGLSDEKAFVFSVALAEINRKILGQRLIL